MVTLPTILILLLALLCIGFVVYRYRAVTYTTEGFAAATPKQIELLLQRASRWALMAEQNPNPQEALRQSSYAMGYLYALQDLAPIEELDKHIDFPDFRQRITSVHDGLARRVSCS